jgi:hypothetical protein
MEVNDGYMMNRTNLTVRQRKLLMLKELEDIIQNTRPGEIRSDLEFTRDRLTEQLVREEQQEL